MVGELHGKVALVTGGATGIGRAATLALAEAGANVLVHYSTSKEDADIVCGLVRALGRQAHALQANFADRQSIALLVEAAESTWGRVDILVNNAGAIEHPIDTLEGGDFGAHLDKWDEVFDVNLRAPYELTWRLAKGMTQRQSGSIVNIASVAGYYALTDAPLYSLSKNALIHFTRQAALRYAPHVRVNAVAPGWIETGFNQGHILTEEFQRQISKHIPQKRVGNAQEVADAILFLVKSGTYVTGTTLTVDGGLTAELR